MRRLPPHVSCRTALVRLALGFAVAAGLAMSTIHAQIPGRNVNMVAGQGWPDGDPFLQRQNEPSIAASTRNPLHLIAGSNDYRTIDLPGLPDEDEDETGDAWLGVFKSVDGGQRWKSGLLPGYPQDKSPEGLASPLKGYAAAADPVVRAGISGLLFYNGLVFDRDENGKSAIFVSRFLDENNQEAGDPITYLGTSLVARSNGAGGRFLDKPWMAVDLPRAGAKGKCEIPLPPKIKKNGKKSKAKTQRLDIGNIYVAYTSIIGDGAALRSEIYLHVSEDCGKSWGKPQLLSRAADRVNQGAMITIDPSDGDVFVTWRRFGLDVGESDGIMVARLPGGGKAHAASWARQFKGRAWKRDRDVFEHRKRRVSEAAELDQFDQNTTPLRFRSNAYPTATVDSSGRLYVAWSERGFAALRPNATEGDARIVMVSSTDGQQFTSPRAIDEDGQAGHQLMPTIAFAGGRLMLVYYDVRETRAQNFGQFVSDAGLMRRQTMDIRAAMGTPGNSPAFAPSVKVSDYLMGFRSRNGPLEQLQVNPPNLPMFKQGTVPFIGDYIDVTAAPVFVPGPKGKWQYNTATSPTPPVFHAVWTDNRDVRPPLNGDWTKYTPPTSAALGPISLVDPTRGPPVCVPGNAGSRNQNVYSSRITGGLVVGSPGNAKQLSPTLQRAFVVFAQNTTAQTRSFRLRIAAQPPGGRASFSQFPLPPFTAQSPAPLTTIDVRVPPRSMAARSVYATSTDPHAQIPVDVVEIAAPGAPAPLPGGLSSTTVINPDVENPDVENPDVENPDVENPDVENAEVYNPDVENPDVENPDVENPDVENPDVENPDVENVVVANPDIDNIAIGNPDVENPDVENPDVENPDVENPDVENGAIADITWSVMNTGNTTAAFNVNLFLSQANIPPSLQTQLVIYKTYKTPVTVPNGCELRFETRNVLVTNISSPNFIRPAGGTLPDPNDPSEKNPTLWLAPQEIGRITLRIVDNDTSNNVFIRNAKGELVSIDPVFNPEENDVTPGISSQAVGTGDAAAGVVDPPVVTPTGSNLLFLQQPSNTTVNTPIAPPVRVRAFDNSGAALTGVTVTMSLNVPGAVLIGGAATTDAAGIATFAALQVGTPGDDYILTATVGGSVPASAQSSRFDVALPVLNADLVVTQSSTQPILNTNTTITLTVTNNGPALATGVVLTDTLPVAATFVTVSDDNCSYNPDSRTVTCQVGTLAPGVSRNYGIVIRPTALTTLINTVAVAGSQPDPEPANSVTVETTFVASYAPCSSPTFVGPFLHPLNTTSTGTLATADFNEDTFPDLFFAEADGNFVLLLSDGDGGFQPPQYVEENNPVGGITADFNNDGHADVAVISQNSPAFQLPAEFGVGLGDGTGNFPNGGEDVFLPLAGTFAIETGDFNHDGNADVVVSSGNTADTTVVVLLGAGDGTFAAPISVPAGTQPGNLVLGDYNVDGHLDIAVNNIGSPTVSILHGNGEGGFSAPQTIALSANSHRLRRVNDVNGDGAPDLAVTTSPGGGVPANLLLLLNNGAGGFHPPTEIIGPRGVGSATTGDLNGDGRLDLAAILFAENRVLIMNGNGQGQFTESATYLTGTSQNQFAITDLNADGRPDIVGTVRGGYYLLFNSCEGGQGASADLDSTVLGPETATVGDELTYTAFILNNGPDPATNVRATFVVPAGMIFVNSTAECSESYGTLQCQRGTLAPEGTDSFTVTVRASAPGLRVSRMMATATAPDPVASNNVGGANTNVAPGPFTFVVTSTADAGLGTLRQAILDSNLNVGSTNQIHFALTGEAPFTIAPRTGLPNINVPVIIDGYTQPGSSPNTLAAGTNAVILIELRGNAAGGTNGLNVLSGGTTIKGLAIGGFGGNGIHLDRLGGNIVHGNFVGTNALGTVANPNNGGVLARSPNNLIGGAALAARNLISGNASHGVRLTVSNSGTTVNSTSAGTVVVNNLIGTTRDGLQALANTGSGVSVSVPNVTIGGISALERNVISGNAQHGVSTGASLSSNTVLSVPSNLVVQGNYVGVTADGAAALPNIGHGILLNGAGSLIGGVAGTTVGACTGACNVISGNTTNGVGLYAHYDNPLAPTATMGTVYSAADGSSIIGNFIGLNAAGTAAIPNGPAQPTFSAAVNVVVPNVVVGGPVPGAGNVISGNNGAGINLGFGNLIATGAIVKTAAGAVIRGNFIGVSPDGMTARGNGSHGIGVSADHVTIGGPNVGDRNIISGNGGSGVSAFAGLYDPDGAGPLQNIPTNPPTQPVALMVINNHVGTNATATAAIPNLGSGLNLSAPAALVKNNVLSGNTGQGLSFGAHFNNVTGQIYATAANAVAEGNMIGVDVTGNVALPNTNNGVGISAPNVRIGGSTAPQRNIIGANRGTGVSIGSTTTTTNQLVTSGSGAVVQGNYVGLAANGNGLMANLFAGITSSAASVTIGGALDEGNVIVSGGTPSGINLTRQLGVGGVVVNDGGASTLRGNIIGLNANQTQRMSGGTGISVSSAGNQILQNVIAGNGIAPAFVPGISLNQNGNNNVVKGNIIGTNPSGDAGLGNAGPGVFIGGASGNTIGGSQPGDRNVIVGNAHGVNLSSQDGQTVSNNRVIGNYLGVKADGATSLPNAAYGVHLFANVNSNITGNTIGGSGAGEGNLISGNGLSGVSLQGSGTTNNTILGNLIGTNATGAGALPNATHGIFITSASDNTIGGTGLTDGNLIAFNQQNGIITDAASVRNRILGNRIHSNPMLGIDLNGNGVSANDPGDGDAGGNNLQNFPVLSNPSNASGTETRIDADLSSFAPGSYTIQFFASATCAAGGYGQGDRLVGSTTLVQPGTNGVLLNELVPAGQAITATATDSNGNTSEFSACALVDVNPTMVNNTNDSGQGSLRAAIISSNTLQGTQTIAFNIPGAGPHSIQPLSPLPVISSPAIIDGYTQPGASANTDAVGSNAILKIVIRGAGVGGQGPTTGLNVTGGGTTIRGLAITGFGNQGIFLDGPAGNNVVEGNFIGTDVTGMSAAANGTGIAIQSPGALIGGAAIAARNVISGNSQAGIRIQPAFGAPPVAYQGSGTTIQNNLVGTTATGMTALGNGQGGIHVSVPNVTIGGTSAALRNVISGNGQSGINTFPGMFGTTVTTVPSNLVVQGNFIGTKADGLAALVNNGNGVYVVGPNARIGGDVNTTPGGACTGACNLIAGNNGSGLWVGNQFDFTTGTVFSSASGTVIEGNYVGVNVTGSAAIPNFPHGIEVSAPGVIIGGLIAAARNVISGNNGGGVTFAASTYGPGNTAVPGGAGVRGVVRGNFIGVNAAGNAALTNFLAGVRSTVPNVTIGGPQAGAVNVIASGPSRNGIELDVFSSGATVVSAATATTIEKNHIGTDLTGTLRLSQGSGVFVTTSDNQILGNVIAGNGTTSTRGSGLTIFGSTAGNNLVKGNYIGETGADIGDLGNTGVGLSIQDASNNIVGGLAATDRNVIVGSGVSGIKITASTGAAANGNQVLNNYIGVKRNGLTPQPNSGGIWISSAPGSSASRNVIGAPGAGNVIGGNTDSGVTLEGAATTNTVVAGNFIGVNAADTTALGNTSAGVQIFGAIGNRIGGSATEGNVIAFNQSGVVVFGEAANNQIRSNRIRSNTSLGIDLGWDGVSSNDVSDIDNGPNDLQNFPVLAGATNSAGPTTRVAANVSSFFPGSYTLEFFVSATCDGSGHGEGGRQVGIFTAVPSGGTQVFTLTEAVPPGQFITATATDANGNTSEFSACASLDPPTIVMNTNDSGPGSLREAIAVANSTPGTQAITFNIPGATTATPAVIVMTSGSLPQITEPVIIDGASQPGYDGLPVIELRGVFVDIGATMGLRLTSSGVTIRGLSLTRFTEGIYADDGFSGHVIENNFIGTNRGYAAGSGNLYGLHWLASSSTIRNNVISGNRSEGVVLSFGSGNTFDNNKIGMSLDGGTIVPNLGAGLALSGGASDNVLKGNLISGNRQWGIDIQFSTGQSRVVNTVIRSNTIGLDAGGGRAGNFLGGIRVNSAPGTQIGVVGAAPNVISGNGGTEPQEIGVGIQVTGNPSPPPWIRNNYIGTDPSGLLARPNLNKGIELDGPAVVGGTGSGEGNLISGHTDPGGGAGIIVGLAGGGSVIQGNIIGLNADGAVLGNGYSGITVRSTGGTLIGGAAAGAGNVISGNGSYGISILKIVPADPQPSGTVIQGNHIGSDKTGTLARGNGQAGISIGGSGHRIGGIDGGGNTIAYNGPQGGISVNGASGPTRVAIEQNSIRENAGLGIDLNADGVTPNDNGDADAGANNTQNFPVIMAATNQPGPTTRVTIDISSFASGGYQLDFFANTSCDPSGHGEGASPVGRFVNVNPAFAGVVTFDLTSLVQAGDFITATATDFGNSTSEFSSCTQVDAAVALTPNPFAIVTNTSAPITVTLSHPAGAGGQTVTLVSNDPVAAVQPSIVIAQGASAGTATITTGSGAGSAIITATAAGFQAGTATVNVSLRGMTLSAASSLVGVGRSLTGTITLGQPAPAGGLAVNLVSGSPSFVTVSPASVTIAQGSTTGAFTINGVAAGPSTITATAIGASNATLNITTTTSSLISMGNPPAIAPGQTSGVAVSLGIDAPPGGVTISFDSINTSVATITPSVFIPAGLRIPAANPQITGVIPGTSSITASAAGFAPDTKVVTVTLTLSFTPATNFAVIAGRTSNITLNLSSPAPAGGLTLNTSIDNTAFATVPATVLVAAGTTSVQVPVTGVAIGTTTIRASGTGIAQATASVRVDPTPPINIGASTIGKDLQVQLSGSLGLAAPPGGVVVTITSVDPSRLLLATSNNAVGSASLTRTVTAGSTFVGTFWVQALAGAGTADIQATAPGYATDTSTMTFHPSGFILNANSFTTNTGAANTNVRVDSARLNPLNGNWAQTQELRGGLTADVAVASSNTGVGTIVGSPAHFTGGNQFVNIAFDPVGEGTSTISLTPSAGFNTPADFQSITATVTQPTLSISAVTIGKDLQVATSGTLGAPAPAGGLDVTITSADAARLRLATTATGVGSASINLRVNAGASNIPIFWVQALDGSGTVQYTAAAPGYSNDSATATLNPSGFIVNANNFSTNTFAPNTSIRIDASRLSPTTLRWAQTQDLRGGLSVQLIVSSSNTAVGTIIGSPVSFPGGDSNQSIAFDPLSGGTSTISLTTPAGFTTPADFQSITATVTAPGITIGNATVGRDLQTTLSITLGATPPAPVDVTVTSNTGSIATITRDGTVAGGTSVTFFNVSTANVGTIFVQGRGLGTTTLTVSAANYNSDTGNVTVDPSGFILNSNNITTNTFAANTSLRVDSSRLNPATLRWAQTQELRGGLPTVNVAVVSSDTNVGTILGSPAAFVARDFFNQTVAFDPATAGTTTISISTPAGFTTPADFQSITATVTAPSINIGNATVGRDLQTSLFITLGATPPSPLTVTVTSNNGGIATLTRNGTVAGGTSVTFTNVTTQSVGAFMVQGRGIGTTTLTVQAAGYNDATSDVTVDPSGFILNANNIATNTFAANTALRIDASRLNPVTLNWAQTQELRGGLAVSVAVLSSNPSVGTIIGSPAAFAAGDFFNQATAFDPAAQGTTTISITTPPGFSTPSNLQSVLATVSAPNILIGNATVGRDLQTTLSITLESPPPTAVTVTVTSTSGAVATITRDGTVAGGTTTTFTNVTTQNVGTIFVQGRGLGATTVTVQAAGYDTATGNVTVDPSGFILNANNITTTANAANTILRVDASRLNPVTLNWAQTQELRGGLTVSVPVLSSNTTAGTILGSPAVFNARDFFNQATSFDPAAAGSSTVSITTPAGFSTPSNLQSITATVNP